MIQKILTMANEHMNNYIKNQLGANWVAAYGGGKTIRIFCGEYRFSVRYDKEISIGYGSYGSFAIGDTDRLEYLQGMATFANSPKMIEGLKEIRDMYAEQLKKYEEED
jgi:hypothetical protein